MKVVIYTFPRDYVQVSYAVRSARQCGFEPILVIDPKDPSPFIEGVTCVNATFPRNGNLNGDKFLRGHVELLNDLIGEDEMIIKMDSDTVLLRNGWLNYDAEFIASRHVGIRSCFGYCYAVSKKILRGMREEVLKLPPNPIAREDIEMGRMAECLGTCHWHENLQPECRMGPFPWKSRRSISFWRNRYDVVVFQVQGRTHDDVRAKMKEFYP